MDANGELRWLQRLDQALESGDAKGELNARKMLEAIGAAKSGADASAIAKDASAFDAAMISAGSSADSILSGVKSLFSDDPGNVLTDGTKEDRRAVMAPLEKEHGVATALGSALPYMAVPVGAGAGLLGRAASVGGKALGGSGAMGARIAANPLLDAVATGAALGAVDQDASAIAGAGGGLLGYGVGRGLGRVIRPMADSLSEGASNTLARAKRLGFKVTPAQQSGSKSGQKWEAGLEGSPWSAGPFLGIKDHNQAVANKIAARAIGETADTVDDAVLGRAGDRISREFDSLANATSEVKLDDTFLDALARIDADTSGSNWVSRHADVNDVIDRALSAASQGKVTAKEYQAIASGLGKKAQAHMKNPSGDRDAGIALFRVKEALDDAMERSLGPQAKARFQQARQQWRALLSLYGNVNTGTGDVSLTKLANKLSRMDNKGFVRGGNQSDLYNAARFGQAFKPAVGDSGTATRSSLRDLGNSISRGVTAGGAIGYAAGDPVVGATMGGLLSGAMPLGSMLGSRAYASPVGRYLATQGILPLTESGRGLLGVSGGRIGAGLLGPPMEQVPR